MLDAVVAFLYLYHNVSKLNLLQYSTGKRWGEDPSLVDTFQRASCCHWKIQWIAIPHAPKTIWTNSLFTWEKHRHVTEKLRYKHYAESNNSSLFLTSFVKEMNYGTSSCFVFPVSSDTNTFLGNLLQKLPIK